MSDILIRAREAASTDPLVAELVDFIRPYVSRYAFLKVGESMVIHGFSPQAISVGARIHGEKHGKKFTQRTIMLKGRKAIEVRRIA